MPPTPARVPREVLRKLDAAGPRYTSYPTALEWRERFGADEARTLLRASQRDAPLSLYVHVPFCKSLCWYCGCNMEVCRDSAQGVARVEWYIDAVLREVQAVSAEVDRTRPVVQIHWGGGTPTHLTPPQLERLHRGLVAPFRLAQGAELAMEVHPPVTTEAQLETLARLGFNRLSLGVQDFSPEVQKAIHRDQPYEQTAALMAAARALGFPSLNIDLIYGLPRQTLGGFGETLERVIGLAPERIALFGYAHVPWMRPHQRLLRDADLPGAEARLDLMELAVERLTGAGYVHVGLDHFALPSDPLARAHAEGTLRRNFMGYTTHGGSDVLAFGSSAISDTGAAYLQNAREVDDYVAQVTREGLAVERGCRLTPDDQARRDVIMTLACQGRVDKAALSRRHGLFFDEAFGGALARLAPLVESGLVTLSDAEIALTPEGRLLVRNVCMAFDAYLPHGSPHGAGLGSAQGAEPAESRYSRTV